MTFDDHWNEFTGRYPGLWEAPEFRAVAVMAYIWAQQDTLKEIKSVPLIGVSPQ